MDTLDLPVEDLRAVVTIGLERGGPLLTAGERVIADRIRHLEGEPARLYARLTGRVPEVFECADLDVPGVSDLPAALRVLTDRALVDGLVTPRQKAEQLTIPRLKEACAARGLRRGGKKADLVERLAECPDLAPGRWVRTRHRGLIRRLERWAFLRRHADRRTFVVERLGHVVWPDYPLTRGPGVHRDRRAMLRWEALLSAELDVETAIRALRTGDVHAAGPLDLGRRVSRDVAEVARCLESSEPERAVAIYEGLAAAGYPAHPVRHARALEHLGAPDAALELLRGALTSRTGPSRLAIHRAGRRLARSRRTGWAPDRPLLKPRKRTVRLVAGTPDRHRPRYRVADRDLTVEHALIAHLQELGRTALHAENGLWTTLFALLFADLYFTPVPGALPTRWLAGPLDLGSPRFYDARRDAADAILDAIRTGEAPDRIAEADARWRGVRLAGARWDLERDRLVTVAEGLTSRALAEIMAVLLAEGWSAARGLPDLAILPGPATKLPDAFPQKLGPGLLLAEVKGPGDAVRDAQALWFHRLRSATAPIALWEVRPRTPDPSG